MQKRSAAAFISRATLCRCITRGLSLLLCFVAAASMISAPSVAHAITLSELMNSNVSSWIDNSTANTWNTVDNSNTNYTVNNAQKYYTNITSSVVDKSGNVTNYYRSGDTVNTRIVDSYNKTFNSIYNMNSTTNNYRANVKLDNFLNSYTTNNNNYTYSADFKSWYYDNTTNNYNYTTNNLYYNQDNSRYYLTIDNSTDEYYFVDVQYSPTFVTVNYTYNTTNINNEKVGDVTNVYYYELKDGRNSSTLTAAEVAGMDLGYDVANYELVTDDPNTLSLQHFDGDYNDSSSFNRAFYSENRSTQYVDSGAFGQAVKLPSGSAAGVTIPGLFYYGDLSFDFRVYYDKISSLGIYIGDTNIFQRIPSYRSKTVTDYYTDSGNTFSLGRYCEYYQSYYDCPGGQPPSTGSPVDLTQYGYSYSNTFRSTSGVPSVDSSGWTTTNSNSYGWYEWSNSAKLHSSSVVRQGWPIQKENGSTQSTTGHVHGFYDYVATIQNYKSSIYRVTPVSIPADFSYDSYKNQWVSMRITIADGKIYYFVNGDLVGSGDFKFSYSADKFYIKSSGTVYLDELRVTTGSLVSTSAYTPPSSPYDTNKVLALPDDLNANTIYVQHSVPVTNHRIGGVRPSNPEKGYFYIPLYDDYTGGQPQLYDGSNWVNVTAMVYDGKTAKDAKGFQFSPVGSAPDIDIDAKPERPEKPGGSEDPDSCTHEWEETSRKDATCTVSGSVEYTCSKCKKTKTETLSKLGHTWKVKETVEPSYDENGEIVTKGHTIYQCSNCGEEYKAEDGTGPPDPGGEIGDGILDKFPSFVNMVLSMFQQLPKLFEGFSAFLKEVFVYVPEDIILLLTFGVAAVVLIGIIKAVRG